MKQRNPVYIIGEGLTEKHYFKHLKSKLDYNIKVLPRLFSTKNSIYDFEKKIDELLQQDLDVICVFDADVAEKHQAEKKKLRNFKKKYKKQKKVILCDSLPSVEFWFLLHFELTHRSFDNTNQLLRELKKYIPGYEKKEKYLKKEAWVVPLTERVQDAVEHAKTVRSRQGSYSNVDKGIELIKKRST